ncbi:unnamed protein product [Triticum turgidum subsp. durum]|uniref:F-box domain-containing protein n=1 Tax=Triticum turgidum subsp. durum TaxID=4567 RepID=A0A9R1NKV6_TRITD|nr:unnamed protein product [Triticum turgidum subsp. durum]
MHRSTTQRPGQRRGARRAVAKPDRLSALPDELLHYIMSFLKAWEVVRSCVLARRWRHLWASVPCVDLRVRPSTGRYGDPPEKFRDFVHRLFLLRDESAPVVMLRLRSSDEEAGFTDDDASAWMMAVIKRNARVIHLTGRCSEIASLDRVSFISCHLKVLKLSYAMLDYRILGQLSSSCTSLEVLGLKDCLVAGPRIVSASLKTLIMLECEISCAFSIAAPNLLLLHLITPYVRVPSFKNLGSLVTATIILDDSFLGDDNECISDEDYCDGTTDDDGDDSDNNDWTESSKIHDESSLSDGVGYDDFIRFGYGHGFAEGIYRHDRYKDNYDCGGDIDSDENTYAYSEIANDAKYGYKGKGLISSKDSIYGGYRECNDAKILGGHHILQSLSSARTLELLTDAREVVLSRERNTCPIFGNLKTLSLGEWCMTADFDASIFLLQHSPNIQKLFLQLKINFNAREASETGIKLQGRSFTCKDLRMVKITCSKDDGRVHKLANLFMANGIPVDKIYVRHSGSAYLRSQKQMKEFWGM